MSIICELVNSYTQIYTPRNFSKWIFYVFSTFCVFSNFSFKKCHWRLLRSPWVPWLRHLTSWLRQLRHPWLRHLTILASISCRVHFGFNLRSNSKQNVESSASLRSAMWYILASISGQIHNKISKARSRFARPCWLFWLQIPGKFILASISGQIQSGNSRASYSLCSAMRFKLATSPSSKICNVKRQNNWNILSSAVLQSAV